MEVKLKEETELWEPRGPCGSWGPAEEPRGPCGSWGPAEEEEHTHNEAVEPARLKEEEPELSVKQEPQELHMVTVKTEDDEDKSSVLHQSEENREETNGWDCGAEAGCSSDPLTQFHSDSEEHTDSSEDTDHSEDYSQQQAPAKRSYAMVPPDADVRDKRPHKCPECGKSFRWRSHLQEHMVTHSGEKPHECPECGKRFMKMSHLQEHMVTHSGQKPHECPECGKKFSVKSHVKRHMLSHSGERPHKCSVCKKGFTQKVSLTKHLRAQHHMCTVCQVRFPDDVDLKEHLKSHVEEGTVDPSVLKSHDCPECGKNFSCKGNLQSHMSVHSGETPPKCSLCDKRFYNKSTLNRHLREQHHICAFCEERFPDRTKLNEHLKTHVEDENPVPSFTLQTTFVHSEKTHKV